jgi:serine phosphatase RsbU (regulator of sigma subunit)
MAAVIAALTYATTRSPLPVNFPWALSSLLAVAVASIYWGVGPAALLLLLMAVSADFLIPDLHVAIPGPHLAYSWMAAIRMALFVACGCAMIFLAHTRKRLAEQSAVKTDVVRSFQTMMLPQTIPAIPGYTIACHYQPAREDEEVGGDFYDLFTLRDGRDIVLVIGDITGKGKEAAASVALLRYTIRAYAKVGMPPDEVLARTNALLLDDQDAHSNATVFIGVLDTITGVLTYCNGGHELPVVASRSGHYRLLTGTSMILGVMPEAEYELKSDRLDSGEAMIVLTDGVTEARNTAGKFLDTDGAAALFAQSIVSSKARDTAERFDRNLRNYAPGVQRDDIAFVVIARRRKTHVRTASAPASQAA